MWTIFIREKGGNWAPSNLTAATFDEANALLRDMAIRNGDYLEFEARRVNENRGGYSRFKNPGEL